MGFLKIYMQFERELFEREIKIFFVGELILFEIYAIITLGKTKYAGMAE